MDCNDLEEYIRGKGACHWKEMAAYHDADPAEVKACLGSLLAAGKISFWTSRHVPWVWWRHNDTAWAWAGKLRDASRKSHPELWPESSRRTRTPSQHYAEQREEREAQIIEMFEEHGPMILAQICEAGPISHLSEIRIRQIIGDMVNRGILTYTAPSLSFDRGRPPYVYTLAERDVDGVEDEDEWRSKVEIIEE